MFYTVNDWYWTIGGDTTQVWSSRLAKFIPATDELYVMWKTGNMAPDLATMAELEAIFAVQYPRGSLKTYSNYKRWQKEQAGITLASGMPIKTDDRAQAKISGVYFAAQVNPAVITPWHAADGSVHELTAAQMEEMNRELITHINACFDISKTVLAGIEGGTITTHEEIDAAYAAPLTQQQKDWLRKP
ncbi:MAG TPA: DUF4376 domain-containing protein [Xanthobacteraceae bacterium]|jgi:hypothetical protein|nr:DUF4376 domain-containing protein [Xanthobacteraceae bacterium]